MQAKNNDSFVWQTEQFADIRILRYKLEGFEKLGLQEKLLIWHLYNAALIGRDIIWDQNYKYNLLIRKTLEAIFVNYGGAREGAQWDAFVVYLKRIWFSNGIHHHYSMDKIFPEFDKEYFRELYSSISEEKLPLPLHQAAEELYNLLEEQIFSPKIAPKRISLEENTDLVVNSACNFYENITQQEAEAYYRSITDIEDPRPVSTGLNSRLIKRDGKVFEQFYKADGLYGKAIRKIIIALEHAKIFALSDLQRDSIDKLIEFYETAGLRSFDDYSILWVQDTEPAVDFVNGFIEVYGAPLAHHGSWQSVVSIRDEEATQRFGQLSELAAYFETNSPIAEEHKRENAEGISYKVIQVVIESGDNAPSSPIGVNLPNADWIRELHGSKSVSLGNIEDAYHMSSQESGSIEEFYLPEQQARAHKFGNISSKLHTGLHEVIGHGSGKILEGVASPKESLKSYANTIEEARADLVALYFIADSKLMEIALAESEEVYKTTYDSFMLNGLMRQLVRLEEGQQLEESHMRNRQLIAKWVYEKAKPKNIIELLKLNGKSYVKINDYSSLRHIFGELLTEVQRIKSEGDYEAAKQLVETYGVKVDKELHSEMRKRWEKLGIAAYAGFIQPLLKPIREGNRIIDIEIEYPEDFTEQMLYYAANYSFLPCIND